MDRPAASRPPVSPAVTRQDPVGRFVVRPSAELTSRVHNAASSKCHRSGCPTRCSVRAGLALIALVALLALVALESLDSLDALPRALRARSHFALSVLFFTFLVLTEFLCRSFFVIEPFLMSPLVDQRRRQTRRRSRRRTRAMNATTMAGLGRRASNFRLMGAPLSSSPPAGQRGPCVATPMRRDYCAASERLQAEVSDGRKRQVPDAVAGGEHSHAELVAAAGR